MFSNLSRAVRERIFSSMQKLGPQIAVLVVLVSGLMFLVYSNGQATSSVTPVNATSTQAAASASANAWATTTIPAATSTAASTTTKPASKPATAKVKNAAD